MMNTIDSTTSSKVTAGQIEKFIRVKLGTDRSWTLKALTRIYRENQTSDEQDHETTKYTNGVGFSGTDAGILSSLASQAERYPLSDKQMKIVFRLMPKYWRQIKNMSDISKLQTLTAQHLSSK